MSLSGALSNAASGLAINARTAALVSSNISNALTEGYGRRSLQVVSNSATTFGGARAIGVARETDTGLIADRRLADAQFGYRDALQQNAVRLEDLVGPATEPWSLAGRLRALDAALISASADPSSVQRLNLLAQSARDVATKFNDISSGIQTARQDAETRISDLVAQLNSGLAQISDLNASIVKFEGQGRDPSSLLDQRQIAIDAVSGIVPVRVLKRDDSSVALYSAGGAVLLDGTPPTFSFTSSNAIAPQMTVSSGLLSGLTRDGRPVDISPDGMLRGGALAAQFEIRDEVTVTLQARLDGMARDLAERFGPGGADTTLLPGDTGVFSDLGSAFAPASEVGFSERIALNPIVAPGASTIWKLRDGLNTATPAVAGDATLINAYATLLSETRAPGSPSLLGRSTSFSLHVSDLTSGLSAARVAQDRAQDFARSTQLALREREMATGVDSDIELQVLMKVEQNYAANAQVVRAVDSMLQELLR